MPTDSYCSVTNSCVANAACVTDEAMVARCRSYCRDLADPDVQGSCGLGLICRAIDADNLPGVGACRP